MIINEGDHHGNRGSSSRAKKLEAAKRISLARFSSRTSASNCLIYCASPVVVPGRFPAAMSACLHQPRKVSVLTPTREPIRCTAWCIDNKGSSSPASCTSRIALSRNSGGYFLGAGIILILSGNQTLHQTRGDSSLGRRRGPGRWVDRGSAPAGL